MRIEDTPFAVDAAGEVRAHGRLAGMQADARMPELHALYWRRAEANSLVEHAMRENGGRIPGNLAKAWDVAETELMGALVDGASLAHLQMLLATERCLQLRPQIERGEGAAAMEAIARCVEVGLTVPGWLAADFVHRFTAVARGLAKTWDAPNAFGPAFPKGANQAGVFARANVARPAYFAALQLLAEDPGASIFAEFFDSLSDRIGHEYGRGTKLEGLISDFVTGAGGTLPSLSEVKPFLQAHTTVDAAMLAWYDTRQRARRSGMPSS